MRYYINVYELGKAINHLGFCWASKREADDAANLSQHDGAKLLYRIHVRLK